MAKVESLAVNLASAVRGGEVFELIGDLGAGKTTFAKAFVRALGSDDEVTSPTYSLRNQYHSDKFEIYHFDLYRIDDLGDTLHELKETIHPESITLIEWAKDIDDLEVIKISIEPTGNIDRRNVSIVVPKNSEYLMKVLDV